MNPGRRPTYAELMKGQARATPPGTPPAPARRGGRRRTAEAPQPQAPNPYLEADLRNAPPPRPEKPVRFTLDLDRERHRYLKQYAAQIEASASEVIRGLLDQMRADDDLRARVRARIWAAKRP